LSTPLTGLPPYKTVAAALRKTTEQLAREVARPSESAPDWNELEWAVARSAAAMQGITVLLANRVRWSGPPAWQSFLTEQREQSSLRHASIGDLLERIDWAAREAGLHCVALKGSALRALDIYAPGERPMSDVDLLVDAADAGAAAAVMQRLDYEETSAAARHLTYEPRARGIAGGLGERADNALAVEIHTLVAEALPVDKVDITARLRGATTRPGLNPYSGLAALLLHLSLHAAGNMKVHALRQIQLHDLARLMERLDDSDWQTLIEIASSGDGLWWAYPPIALTLRYYDCALPRELKRALRASCPLVLRRVSERHDLTDVSWSNLRISALPGIAWSRSPGDLLRYARSRVLPNRDTLELVRSSLERQPQLQRVAWYQLSQGRRIARWLLSRPPRVQTITSVAAALRYPEA
jgi:putative nucleotidyltransferase-like protein